MGLSATAFATATLTEPHEETEECWDGNHVRAFIIDPDFHRSLRGLVADRCYQVERSATYVDNSYGGHGMFRAKLSRIFLGVEPDAVWSSPEEYADRPFFELIQFADNEGTIGPDAASDLAADFRDLRARWRGEVHDEWDRRKYDEWAAVFDAAANGGLVRFA